MFGGVGSEGITTGAQSVSQVQESQKWHSPASSVGGGLIKGTSASASTSVWEKAAPPALTLMPNNSVPPHVSLMPCKQLT